MSNKKKKKIKKREIPTVIKEPEDLAKAIFNAADAKLLEKIGS